MTIKMIQQLLKKEMGLDSSTVGSSAISYAMRKRMQEHGLTSDTEYTDYLKATQDELHYLIEEVVIPETWFFRDSAPFTTVGEYAKKHLLHKNSTTPIRILSIPSSTGEEPYSIAISLLEQGLNINEFFIDAMDISNIALQLARSAIYGKNSFRGKQNNHIIEKYFVADGGHMHLKQLVKDTVNFSKNNLLASSFPNIPESYNIIFCRNLLIYFSKEDKKKALAKLTNLLCNNGLLVVGHSECGIIPHEIFSSFGGARSFSYLKSYPEKGEHKPTPAGSRRSRSVKYTTTKPKRTAKALDAKTIDHRAALKASKSAKTHSKKNKLDNDHSDKPHSLASLDDAAVLADQGSLAEARKICKAYLLIEKDNARAYTLLGVVDAASGTLALAEEHFRKAIYLDPHNHEALVHLSYIVKQRGDNAGAELLRRRAERAKNRKTINPNGNASLNE